MNTLEAIYTRRSVRDFTSEPISRDKLTEIIKAGSWAPSGLNNQPWRFVVVCNREKKNEMGRLTKYRRIVEAAPACIAVFVDREAMYNEVKDYQSVGACLQNMLLAAHALGLGAVWLGEILNRGTEVRDLLAVGERYDLMAVVAVGHPVGQVRQSQRHDVNELLLAEW